MAKKIDDSIYHEEHLLLLTSSSANLGREKRNSL